MLFLINTITNWDEPPRARHQVAFALVKKQHSVIFISANKLGFPRLKELNISENLTVINPYFWFDRRFRIWIPFLNTIYQKWLFKKLLKKYGQASVINFDFTANYLSNYFDNTIYYCNDDHISLSYVIRPKWIADYHNSCEQKIARSSKFCVGTSNFLSEKLKKLNQNSFEIRLGAPDITGNSFIINKRNNLINVGFVGYFDTANQEILKSILSDKDFAFTIVGPIDKTSANKLNILKNVKLTGNLTGQKLLDTVAGFDVGLIPYNLSSKIDRTPNKLWLYLAAGVPTVISNIRGIKDWDFPDKFVYRANDVEEFHDLIRKAHSENSEIIAKQRIEFAKNNSWDKRIESFLSIYNKLIPHN